MSALLRDLTPMAIQAMAVADLDEVLAIEQQAYSHPWTRGNFIDSLSSGYLSHVWRDDQGQLQGYFLAMQVLDEMHLLNITVHPRLQRQRLGWRMLELLAQLARERGCRQLWLEVRESNAPARRLYEAFGLRQLGLRRDYYPAHGGRENALLMGLDLPQESPS